MEEGLTAKAMVWTTHCAMESGEFYCSFSKKKKKGRGWGGGEDLRGVGEGKP